MPKFGKRSKERLRGIDARLVSVLNELVKIMDVTIIEGLRSEQRQEKLLKEGSTKTKFSKHITGKAVDLAPYPIDWNDRDRFHYFAGYVIGIASSMGIKIRWGGDWDMDTQTKDNNFDDLPHFELKK